MAFIDAYRGRCGVEPICRALQFAPSTYWSAKRRPVSARSKRDAALKVSRRGVGVHCLCASAPSWTHSRRSDLRTC